jgi:peptide/nickel transport system substrate-binding protein
MLRTLLFLLLSSIVHFALCWGLPPVSLAQEWKFGRALGTLKVVDFISPQISVMMNCAEGLITLDKNNEWSPCLADDWRWINDLTVEFKLRRGVRFQNGEPFNADAVKANWEAYRRMESPRPHRFLAIADETIMEIIDDYMVRFTFPEPDGLAFVKFHYFFQIAPKFFKDHQFDEKNWGYFPVSGPWGTGPFNLVEGNVRYSMPSHKVVLKANSDYWDRRFPRLQKVIFDNTLISIRKKAMTLCKEQEGKVDLISHIRPIDTLKIVESPFGKVLKSRDITFLGGWFNHRKHGSKWKDIRLRKALNYAINRKELWKYAAKGNAYNLGGFLPSGAYGHNSSLELLTYDTEEAKALLSEAGYPDGFDMKLIV